MKSQKNSSADAGAAAQGKKPGKDRKEKKDKQEKPRKPRKPKVVRDSFTMPEDDYARLVLLKKRCLDLGIPVKKSELLRAGLQALTAMKDAALVKVVESVEQIKTGRPSGD
jgi:hypothetical protein